MLRYGRLLTDAAWELIRRPATEGGAGDRRWRLHSDSLRVRWRRGIQLIGPHKKNRVRPATQDGRKLRRCKQRWIVERTI